MIHNQSANLSQAYPILPVTHSESRSDHYYDLFYQGKLLELISEIEKMNPSQWSELQLLQLNLLKIEALQNTFQFETMATAIASLKKIEFEKSESPEFLNALGRLKRLNGELELAEQVWRENCVPSVPIPVRLQALIELGELYVAQQRWLDLEQIVRGLDSMEKYANHFAKIRSLCLKMEYFREMSREGENTEKCHFSIIEMATKENWQYFILKAYASLALLAKKNGHASAYKIYSEIVSAFAKNFEDLSMRQSLQDLLTDSSRQSAMDIDVDDNTKRVRVGKNWFDFHKTPMLFHFFTILHRQNAFVTKDYIAKVLWGHENYKPRIHDPRIFNIAKRVREIISSNQNVPIQILSGRFGYKLTLRQDS